MRIFFLAAVLVFSISTAFAQLSSLPSNLSSYRSSDVKDEMLSQIVTQMQRNNVNSTQVYQLLIQRGMANSEASLLKDRIDAALTFGVNNNNNSTPNTSPGNPSGNSSGRMPIIINDTVAVINPKKIFGLEIFNNGVFDPNPNLKIATPVNYVIGPDDEIVINIYGYQEAKHTLTVSPEGDITIPYAGSVYVSGLTMEQASAKIKAKLAGAGYSNIRTGLTKVNISVGRIRSIKITILGEVRRPGTYTLSSLSSVFNALYLSGGPNEIGSMRNIQVNRGGKIIDTLDMYDFLINGDQSGNILLRDQDVIRIPTYQTRVSVEGEVKRTGLFEVKKGESLERVLTYAGGFTDSAYTASVKGYKLTDTEKKIIDISSDQLSSYYPSRTESFVVGKVIDRYANRVTISGAVYLPGDYELNDNMKLSALLKKAQGLKEDAYMDRAFIRRFKDDLTEEFVSFSPASVLNGSQTDILLKREDSVVISSVSDLKESFEVSVYGEVRNPGSYPYRENMTLKDIILLSGGFTDAASSQRIEIGRRLKKDNFDVNDIQIAKVIAVESIQDLNTKGADVTLSSWDVVIVRANPGYKAQVNVRVNGEVAFPGDYVLSNKNEKVSDILKRSGGITTQAYTDGAYITRVNEKAINAQTNNSRASKVQSQQIDKLQSQIRDTSNQVMQEVLRPYDQIAINLTKILQAPGGIDDLVLHEGDVLTIPQRKAEVRISGEVLFPTQVVYEEGKDLKDYISRAGGFTDNASKKRIYVLYPNGNASKPSSFLFFRSYPKITPGSEIIIPKKSDRSKNRLSTAEIVGITTAITSLGGVLILLIQNMK